ncbi:MAG: type II toxin-antitoxin system VapC family toxin [Candidatus Eremiobacterota bacterium]
MASGSLYVESSAVLAWLLEEPAGNAVADYLSRTADLVTSALTWVECDRALHRCASLGQREGRRLAEDRRRMNAAAGHWAELPVSAECLLGARQAFPVEPVRSLDALHLASALLARDLLPDLRVLSLDDRIRVNALQMGFQVLP